MRWCRFGGRRDGFVAFTARMSLRVRIPPRAQHVYALIRAGAFSQQLWDAPKIIHPPKARLTPGARPPTVLAR